MSENCPVNFTPSDIPAASGELLYIYAVDSDGNFHYAGWFYSSSYYPKRYWDKVKGEFEEIVEDFASKYPVVRVVTTPLYYASTPPPRTPPSDCDNEDWEAYEERWKKYVKEASRGYIAFKERVYDELVEMFEAWRQTGKVQHRLE